MYNHAMKVSLVACLCILVSAVTAQQYETYKAPKPAKAGRWVAPNKPVTRLADLKAKHAGHADWTVPIVRDELLEADYISSAPGSSVSKRFHPDTRAWWVVMEGAIRFDIEGRQPFVAHAGSIVQVPKQTMFAFATAGDKPAVRFEVNIAGATTLYPKDAEPARMTGYDFVPIRLLRQPGPYGEGNKPVVTFDELAANPKYVNGLHLKPVIMDDRANSTFIYGYEKNLPPENPKNRGHYHTSSSEFWVIMAGQLKYTIETQDPFIVNIGDVVYVPPFTYHAPRFHGDAPACRLAMNGYPGIAHLWDDMGTH
jgi:quercetin dioxygenase-like cupin family protein